MQTRERTTQNERERTPRTERTLTESRSFALRYAKRSFEPTNTNPTPEMFEDKWAASD